MASMVATTQHRRTLRWAGAAIVCALALSVAPAGAATATGSGPAPTGSLIGHVSAPSADSSTMVPVAGIAVTATAPTGIAYGAVTDTNGFYELDGLPAPASYAVTFTASDATTQTTDVAVPAGTVATVDDSLNQPVATIAGAVTDQHGRALPGMAIGLSVSTPCPAGTICAPS